MPANPYQVLYFNPHISAQRFAKMVEKYNNEKEIAMLNKCAEITGYKLVPSDKLNWRQRKKYMDNKFQIGHYVYYLLPCT